MVVPEADAIFPAGPLQRQERVAAATAVVGVDIPFTPPANPDLVIDNGEDPVDLDQAALTILEAARAKFAS